MLKIYGDKKSGNCLKVLYLADYLGLPYTWIDVDIMQRETRTEAFLARNPAGQIPLLELDDGRFLSQSNAILLYLARTSRLIPADPWSAAKMQEWLFWEQYSHEPTIAVCRFHKVYLGKSDAELDPVKLEKGNAALDLMDNHLQRTAWLAGDGLTIADISLLAYTRLAHEGGFDLTARSALRNWIDRVETELGIG
jgi:glutathione S-transferase